MTFRLSERKRNKKHQSRRLISPNLVKNSKFSIRKSIFTPLKWDEQMQNLLIYRTLLFIWCRCVVYCSLDFLFYLFDIWRIVSLRSFVPLLCHISVSCFHFSNVHFFVTRDAVWRSIDFCVNLLCSHHLAASFLLGQIVFFSATLSFRCDRFLCFFSFYCFFKLTFCFNELQSEKLFNCACASCIFIMFPVVFLVIITDFIGWVDELVLTTIVFCFSQCFLESVFCVRVRLMMPWSCLLLDFSCRRNEYSSGRICNFHWRRVWCDAHSCSMFCVVWETKFSLEQIANLLLCLCMLTFRWMKRIVFVEKNLFRRRDFSGEIFV